MLILYKPAPSGKRGREHLMHWQLNLAVQCWPVRYEVGVRRPKGPIPDGSFKRVASCLFRQSELTCAAMSINTCKFALASTLPELPGLPAHCCVHAVPCNVSQRMCVSRNETNIASRARRFFANHWQANRPSDNTDNTHNTDVSQYHFGRHDR